MMQVSLFFTKSIKNIIVMVDKNNCKLTQLFSIPLDLTKTPLKEGHQVMLMGTADIVAMPTESIVFLEDMTDVQKAEKVMPAEIRIFQICYTNLMLLLFAIVGSSTFSWIEEYGQHVLHERNSAVLQTYARTQRRLDSCETFFRRNCICWIFAGHIQDS
jgi:hypothetical protein